MQDETPNQSSEQEIPREKTKKWRGWLIAVILIIIISVIGWLVFNNLYIAYYSESLGDPNIYCEWNVLKENGAELTSLRIGTIAEIFCAQYSDSKYLIYCENNIPIINCKTTLFKLYFSKK